MPTISAFKGIQNTVSKRDIEDNALQDAVDVEITDAGGFVARKGNTLALETPIDTAYTTLDDTTYVVYAGQLSRVTDDLTLLPLTPSTATEFCDHQRVLFTNDGLSIYQDAVQNLVIPVPELEPELLIANGSSPAGIYSVIYTYVNASGVEGGTSPVASVELTEPGDVFVYPVELPGFTARVYMTEAGGEVFYNLETGVQINPVQVNANQFPKNANKIEYFDSKVYVTEEYQDYTVVWFSKAYHYHLFGVDNGYFVVTGKVEVLRAVTAGLLIGTDREIFIYSDGVLNRVATYGVVSGRPVVKLPNDTLLIHTVRGVCSFPPFTALTEDKVSLPMGTICSTKMVYSNGIKKFIALHDGGGEAFNRFNEN